MRFLLLNQTFYPDVMATGQYLAELAEGLVKRGHEVTVVTSRRAYDEPERRFLARERWRGVEVCRVGSTGFGKGAKWRRAMDFGSFTVATCARLVALRKPDAVVALTSPPLISFIGAVYARFRGCRFYYWVMDFNPDEAIAAGWLRAESVGARLLEWMSRYSLRRAERIVALDGFMGERILGKGIVAGKVAVIPPWSHDGEVRFDPEGRDRFRRAHGLEGKFVVMYSGNHSPVHPLDTVLSAAERLAEDREIVFVFVGGGSEWGRVRDLAQARGARGVSIVCLPYQPLQELSGSLSAADAHVVVMGDRMLGLVHPCKIYNILSVGAPVVYIGPEPSHVTEILKEASAPGLEWISARHGEVETVVRGIKRLRSTEREKAQANGRGCRQYSKEAVLPRLIEVLEGG